MQVRQQNSSSRAWTECHISMLWSRRQSVEQATTQLLIQITEITTVYLNLFSSAWHSGILNTYSWSRAKMKPGHNLSFTYFPSLTFDCPFFSSTVEIWKRISLSKLVKRCPLPSDGRTFLCTTLETPFFTWKIPQKTEVKNSSWVFFSASILIFSPQDQLIWYA